MHTITIAARNYLQRARVLARTHLEHNPDDAFTILEVELQFPTALVQPEGRGEVDAVLLLLTGAGRILHAHGTSLFIAVAASLFSPRPIVIWHDHFGASRIATRPQSVYRLALRRVAVCEKVGLEGFRNV